MKNYSANFSGVKPLYNGYIVMLIPEIRDIVDSSISDIRACSLPEHKHVLYIFSEWSVDLALYTLSHQDRAQGFEKLLTYSTLQSKVFPETHWLRYYFQHIQNVCQAFIEDQSMLVLLKRFSTPIFSEWSKTLLIRSLKGRLTEEKDLDDRMIQTAVLSALFTLIRQTIGSCFATVACMEVQSKDVKQMLDDLFNLLFKGKITRVFHGEEYKAPIASYLDEHTLKDVIHLERQLFEKHPSIKLISLELTEKEKSHLYDLVKRISISGQMVTLENLINLFIQEYYPSLNLSKLTEARYEGDSPHKNESAFYYTLRALACDPYRHPLAKVWEYSIASFADAQIGFFKINLINALGVERDAPYSIAGIIHSYVNDVIDSANTQLVELETHIQESQHKLDATHAHMSQKSDSLELRRLKAEADYYHSTLDLSMADRQELLDLHKELIDFPQKLFDQYVFFFPMYFQEVYDPNIQEVESTNIEDAPAGFRLVYKHGRFEPTQWTPIRDREHYASFLKSFFIAVEPQLFDVFSTDKQRDIIASITRDILSLCDDPKFVDAAMHRVREKHRSIPGLSSSSGAISSLPWAYTSGGTVDSLLSTYFCFPNKFDKVTLPSHDANDFAVAFIDYLKDDPKIDPQDLSFSYLFSMPNHICRIRPFHPHIKEAVSERSFSYTWFRDRWLAKELTFWQSIKISLEDTILLLKEVCREYPDIPMNLTQQSYSLKAVAEVIRHLPLSRTVINYLMVRLKILAKSHLPFVSSDHAKSIAKKFNVSLQLHGSQVRIPSSDVYDSILNSIISARKRNIDLAVDDLEKVFREQKVESSRAFVFADANWSIYWLAFQIDPIELTTSLWRTFPDGRKGMPLDGWDAFFSDNPALKWQIYNSPSQYSKSYHSDAFQQPHHKKV